MPPQFWLWAAVIMGGVLVAYWWFSERAVARMRAEVMAEQRVVRRDLGPSLAPFVDRLEAFATGLASERFEPTVHAGWSYSEVAESPGVYLRARIENAVDRKALRKAAAKSLHDGFTSCFFRRSRAYDPTEGPRCVTSVDCATGLLCNEYDACVEPPEPYNLRLVYRALRVLSDEWTEELHLATTGVGLRGYQRDLDAVRRRDVPIARDVLAQAEYATVVLDEQPRGGLPAAAPGEEESDEERLHKLPHFVRVGVLSLTDGVVLLKARVWAEGKLIRAGGSGEVASLFSASATRQANSCSIALGVQQIQPPSAGVAAAPADDAQ